MPVVISKCEKCGRLQKPNKEKSNENWLVYDRKQKCECGGEFKTERGAIN